VLLEFVDSGFQSEFSPYRTSGCSTPMKIAAVAARCDVARSASGAAPGAYANDCSERAAESIDAKLVEM
jgi:hypothetical protein